MDDTTARRIASHPSYHQLRKQRLRFGWLLTVLMLIVYYGFITLVAFDKALLSTRLGDGVMTLGMPIGLGVILFTIVITAVYVRRANSRYDTLTADVAKAVQQ